MRHVKTDGMCTPQEAACCPLPAARFFPPAARHGFTLVEVMVAATITLLLMGGVVTMFGYVTNKVTDSRAVVELTDQLRNAKQRLQLDLMGVTAPTIPPLNPDAEQGYFEVIEGPMGPVLSQYSGSLDYSVGDNDDVLMFTTRGVNGEQFNGRGYPSIGDLSAGLLQSPLAEIGWFMRNSTLYRRVLLIRPSLVVNNSAYYAYYDLSMRQEGGIYDHRAMPLGTYTAAGAGAAPYLIGNTLGDLTKRENRYAHQPLVFPYDARFWNHVLSGNTTNLANRPGFGLPTLYETGSTAWSFPYYGPPARSTPTYTHYLPDPLRQNDPLAGPFIAPCSVAGPGNSFTTIMGGALQLHGASNTSGYSGWTTNSFLYTATASADTVPGFSSNRYDDVVMNHVLSFDVRVWDPGAPVFQVRTTSAGTPGAYTAVLPGDPGYNYALNNFRANPSPSNTTAALSSLGAYVDLNYMYPIEGAFGNGTVWGNALKSYAQKLYQINSAVVNPSYGYTNGYGYFYYYPNNYVGASGQQPLLPLPWFALNSNPQSGIWTRLISGTPAGTYPAPYGSIWDTWSTHYEHDGIDNDLDGLIDEGVDGIDNPTPTIATGNPSLGSGTNRIRNLSGVLQTWGNYGVDDASEMEAPPPYRYPLRGIQIKIRAYENDTKQIREVTVVHEFLQE